MPTETIYLRVKPDVKTRLQTEAIIQKTTMQHLIDDAIELLFQKIDRAAKKSSSTT